MATNRCHKDGSKIIQNGRNLRAFSGYLDGNGKTITIPEGGLPLLGYVKNAEVHNLNIYGKKIAGYGLVNTLSGVGLSGNAIIIDNVTLKSGSSTLKSGLIGTEIPVTHLQDALLPSQQQSKIVQLKKML